MGESMTHEELDKEASERTMIALWKTETKANLAHILGITERTLYKRRSSLLLRRPELRDKLTGWAASQINRSVKGQPYHFVNKREDIRENNTERRVCYMAFGYLFQSDVTDIINKHLRERGISVDDVINVESLAGHRVKVWYVA